MTTTSPSRGLVVRLTGAALRWPARFVVAALALAACSIWLASGLEIRSNFEELLPSDVPSVLQVKQLIRRVGGDGTVLVVIESLDHPANLKSAEALAPALAREFLEMGKEQIRAVDWNIEPVRKWYEDHWPLFASTSDLEKARDAIRDEVAKGKAAANPLVVSLDDEEPAQPAASSAAQEWLDPKKPLPREQVAARFVRYRDGFFVHPDGASLTLIVRPAGTSLGVSEARALIDRMQKVIDRHQDELRAGHLRVGFGGTFPQFVAEYEAILHDVSSTALLVTSLVLLSIFLFFRDGRSVLSLGFAVLIAVAITFGLTRLIIGYLNTQTAFLGSIVVGNGINYGLIYLARVKQLRWQGVPLGPACIEAAQTTARATLLASAATSVSFGVLIIAANRGFRHFGFIGGVGMLLCWICTFALVPAVLTLWEKLRGAPKPRAASSGERFVPALARLFAAPRAIAAVFAVLTLAAGALFLQKLPNAMERNLENLTNELKGQAALIRDNDRAQSSLGKSIAGSIALFDSPEEADEFCAVIRERQKEPQYKELIDGCDTVSSVVPAQQEEKLALLRDIRGQLSDRVLARLQPAQRARLQSVRDELDAQKPVSAQDAPPSLVDRFRERDGTVGRIAVVTASPNAKTELAPNLKAFVRGVRNVQVRGKSHDATGENVIFADLLENIEHEGPRTTFLSFAGVCLLVLLFFRNLRTSLEVVGSLFVGVVLMGGAAALMGLKINFFNFIVFPITFGIAVDYGANVAARVRERSGEVLESLAEVGPAVALCSWTSIIGYGSLLFSLNRALRSFGFYAMVGEVTTIVTALFLLPALLLLARRSGQRAA